MKFEAEHTPSFFVRLKTQISLGVLDGLQVRFPAINPDARLLDGAAMHLRRAYECHPQNLASLQ